MTPSNSKHHPGEKPTNTAPTEAIAPDCRHYRGDRPCLHNRLCNGCTHYAPYSHRICVIKLGALGDVIRTLCILPEMRRQYPDAQITWVSMDNGCRMIANHPQIDRVVAFNPISLMALQQEQFDLLICLDKEPAPCALAMNIKAKQKLGVGLSEHGSAVPINPQAEHYFHLGLSDHLKYLRNQKSYPQLIYEALGWEYQGQRYELPVEQKAVERIQSKLIARDWRRDQPTVGIFVGAGRTFVNKMWSPTLSAEIIRDLNARAAVQIILLGGPDERELMDQILTDLRRTGQASRVIDGGSDHDESCFVALVDACDIVVCGDTMAMHVAVARQKDVVAFFGPTCEQEIDLFGRGVKLIAKTVCAPCYKRVCDQENACVEQITDRQVTNAVMSRLGQTIQIRVSAVTGAMKKVG